MSFPYLSDLVYFATGYHVFLPIPMFGILVALAMLGACVCLSNEGGRLHRSGRIGTARRPVKEQNGRQRSAQMAPQTVVSDFTVVVLLAGVIGARLFHVLEHGELFLADPLSMVFSRSGLSVFGGLIFGTVAGLVLLQRWGIDARPFLDAIAPPMMLGYAIGRLGCQISGDGDWGTVANMGAKPAWLPTWLWAQTYENNIFGEVLAAPGVYPTPVYETMMAMACFAVLWAIRKHSRQPGWLFSVYLVMAGAERHLIEQIRVNVKFELYGVRFTQAELIATIFLVVGMIGIAMLRRRSLADVHARN
jgi:phosphatidylglycerol:prolipoprotein diacylglycerol transferase